MALRQWRRGRKLAAMASELDLTFASEDPFDLPNRYAGFSLMQAGHSAQANHVIFGRLSGLSVRAFDLRYEAGHGPQRLLRHHSVVAVEGEWNFPWAMLWSASFVLPVLPMSEPVTLPSLWQAMGDLSLAQRLVALWPGQGGRDVLIETHHEVALFAFSRRLQPLELKSQMLEIAGYLTVWAQNERPKSLTGEGK